MNNEVYNYLKKYVLDKFPMYYDKENQKEFLNFLSVISSDIKFVSELKSKMVGVGDNNSVEKSNEDSLGNKKSVKVVLELGLMDNIIDELVNTYAQKKFTGIWKHFDRLSEIIKRAIEREEKNNSSFEIISDELLNKICMDIALGIIKREESDDYSQYENGSFDNKFVEDYGYYEREYMKNVLSYVEKIIERKLVDGEFKVTDDTYEELLSGVSYMIISDYKYNDIVSGNCDRQIIKAFNFYRKKLREAISSYVRSIVVDKATNLLEIKIEDVIDDILMVTTVTGEISADKLLDGKLDSMVMGVMSRNRKSLPSMNDAIKYIYRILVSEDNLGLENDQLSNIAEKIYQILCSDGLFDREIVSSDYNSRIVQLFEKEKRVMFSVKDEKKSNKVKISWLKRLMNKRVLSLVLVGTITVAGGKLVIESIDYIYDFGSELVNDIKNLKPLDAVDDFDNFKYTHIFTTRNDDYDNMVLNIPEFYQKAKVYGEDKYSFLGFYRVYDNIMYDKLAVMDSTLMQVQRYSSKEDGLSDLYDSISGYSCYLDFVCDRLRDMGFEEIDDKKYQDAIKIYKNAKEAATGDLTAMDILDCEFPEYAKVIREIMEKYRKYSDQCEVDFGNYLIKHNKNNSSGRLV